MKILGIIVEYNPMHNGHIYQIEQAKKLINPDYTIIIMSGGFTEQGNLSVLDKFTKAEIAIQNGVDLVLELPTIYATSSAEYFAKGAVNILNNLNCITHLVFGAECSNIQTLKNIATTLNKYEKEIIQESKLNTNKNITMAKTRSEILNKYLNNEEIDCIDKPNNILAIEYLRNLELLNSKIEPVLIHRNTIQHNSTEFVNNIASSTAIRGLFQKQDLETIQKLVPSNVYNNLLKVNSKYLDTFWNILKYEIIKLGKNGIQNIYEVSEGLENRIIQYIEKSNSYEEFIQNIKSKRYTLGRIKRICINTLLGITKDTYKALSDVQYAKIIKFSNRAEKLVSHICKMSQIPVFSKITDNEIDKQNNNIKTSLELDILSTKIHNILFNENKNDYTNNVKEGN